MERVASGRTGAYNFAYGLDGVFRLFGDDYLTLQWAHSFDDALVDQPGYRPLNGGRMTVQMERRRSREWEYRSIVAWAGPDYRPGVGFSQRNDFTLLDQALSYTWLPPEGARLIFHTLEMTGSAICATRTVPSNRRNGVPGGGTAPATERAEKPDSGFCTKPCRIPF